MGDADAHLQQRRLSVLYRRDGPARHLLRLPRHSGGQVRRRHHPPQRTGRRGLCQEHRHRVGPHSLRLHGHGGARRGSGDDHDQQRGRSAGAVPLHLFFRHERCRDVAVSLRRLCRRQVRRWRLLCPDVALPRIVQREHDCGFWQRQRPEHDGQRRTGVQQCVRRFSRRLRRHHAPAECLQPRGTDPQRPRADLLCGESLRQQQFTQPAEGHADAGRRLAGTG